MFLIGCDDAPAPEANTSSSAPSAEASTEVVSDGINCDALMHGYYQYNVVGRRVEARYVYFDGNVQFEVDQDGTSLAVRSVKWQPDCSYVITDSIVYNPQGPFEGGQNTAWQVITNYGDTIFQIVLTEPGETVQSAIKLTRLGDTPGGNFRR